MKYVVKSNIGFGDYLVCLIISTLIVVLTFGLGIFILPIYWGKKLLENTIIYDTVDERGQKTDLQEAWANKELENDLKKNKKAEITTISNIL